MINSKLDDINLFIEDNKFYLADKDISKEIRSVQVTKNVSLVSSYRKVREKLVEMQRKIAKQSNIILDGRDIGSYVLKDASIKFFLTATAEERARRRLQDNKESNQDFEAVLADIKRRDDFDSTREITPLKQAEDAILIDSTDLSEDGVIYLMKQYLEQKHVI